MNNLRKVIRGLVRESIEGAEYDIRSAYESALNVAESLMPADRSKITPYRFEEPVIADLVSNGLSSREDFIELSNLARADYRSSGSMAAWAVMTASDAKKANMTPGFSSARRNMS